MNDRRSGSMNRAGEQPASERDRPTDRNWLSTHSILCESGPELVGTVESLVGHVVMAAAPSAGLRVYARYKPGIPEWALSGFKALAADRIYAFLRQGSNPGDWFPRDDGDGWQMNVSYRQAEQFREDHPPPDPTP